MKTVYFEPVMEVIRLNAMDVIVTSGCGVSINEPDDQMEI